MQILFLTSTFQSAKMLEANSLINIVLTLMRGIWEVRPDWRFTWAVNMRDEETALYLQKRIADPRCQVVFIGCDYGTAERIDILSGSAAKVLAQSRGKVFYDVAISAHPLLLPYFTNVSNRLMKISSDPGHGRIRRSRLPLRQRGGVPEPPAGVLFQ